MSFIFPPNPSHMDLVIGPNGATWLWDGVKWVGGMGGPYAALSGATMEGELFLYSNPTLPMEAATKDYVDYSMAGTVGEAPFDGQAFGRELGNWTPVLPITGGIMRGSINFNGWQLNGVPVPVLPLEAANKEYVDEQVAKLQVFLGTWQVAANIPDLSVTSGTVDGAYYIAVTANPNVAEVAPLGIPGIGGTAIWNASTIIWNAGLGIFEAVLNSRNPGAIIDTVPPPNPVIGDLWFDSVEGQLYIWYEDATSAQWVVVINDSGSGSGFLPLAGGTVTGNLTVNGILNAAGTLTVDTFGPGTILCPGRLEFVQNTSTANGTGNVQISPLQIFNGILPPTQQQQLGSFLYLGDSGGTPGQVSYAMFGATTVYGPMASNSVGGGFTCNFDGTGGGAGKASHGAMIAYGARLVAITNPTTTVSTTLTAPSNVLAVGNVSLFRPGVPIQINGNPYFCVGVAGNTIILGSFVPVVDGTAGNVVTANDNPQMWGANIYCNDTTGLPSVLTNFQTGIELDLMCNGADNAGTLTYGTPVGVRVALNIVTGQWIAGGAASEIASAVQVATGGGSSASIKRVFSIADSTHFSQAAFDTRAAVQGVNANTIWLAQSQNIALDNAGPNGAVANVSLHSDGNNLHIKTGPAGGIVSTGNVTINAASSGWSSFNIGKQLIIEGPQNNAIGIADIGNTSFFAICNTGSTLMFASMPPLSDSTTPPTVLLQLETTGSASGRGITINAQTSGWSSFDIGKQLIIEGPQNNAIGIGDSTNASFFAISNTSGTLLIASMPLLTDNTTPPTQLLQLDPAGARFHQSVGVWNTAPPAIKPVVSGSRGGNVALTSLLTALASYGLVTDSSTP
jgi:hypothetical protein